MSKPSFVYTIYIHATPEQVWQGLIDPEFTRVYWMHEQVSDWEVGSRWELKQPGEDGKVHNVGEVLEFDEPHRMAYTWVLTDDEGDAAKTSRVLFEIEPQDWPGGPWVALKLTHSELESGSDMLASISWGWPALMSGLKTLLESPRLFGIEPQETAAVDDK
jgi:uncharacterized protein YndB with AHSA1/START domain